MVYDLLDVTVHPLGLHLTEAIAVKFWVSSIALGSSCGRAGDLRGSLDVAPVNLRTLPYMHALPPRMCAHPPNQQTNQPTSHLHIHNPNPLPQEYFFPQEQDSAKRQVKFAQSVAAGRAAARQHRRASGCPRGACRPASEALPAPAALPERWCCMAWRGMETWSLLADGF